VNSYVWRTSFMWLTWHTEDWPLSFLCFSIWLWVCFVKSIGVQSEWKNYCEWYRRKISWNFQDTVPAFYLRYWIKTWNLESWYGAYGRKSSQIASNNNGV
jgi:hypothetical protein